MFPQAPLWLLMGLHISNAKIHLISPLSEYEGHSINKLQNSLILLAFQILKIKNIHFVGNLFLSCSCEFDDDDFTLALLINIKYGDVATERTASALQSKQFTFAVRKY